MLFKRRKLKNAVEKRDNIITLIESMNSISFLSFYISLNAHENSQDKLQYDFTLYDFLMKIRHKIMNQRGRFFVEYKNIIRLIDKLDGYVLWYDTNSPIIDRYVSPLRKKHIYNNKYIFIPNIQMQIIIKNALRDNLLVLPSQTDYYNTIARIKQDEKQLNMHIKIKPDVPIKIVKSIIRDPENGQLIIN